MGGSWATRTHEFGDFGDRDRVEVVTLEVLRPESYGQYTWACAESLARHVWRHRARYLPDAAPAPRVVELGAGTALPGLLFAKLGARVTLTDAARESEVLANLASARDANRLDPSRVDVLALDWGALDASALRLAALGVDLVLGADVLYDKSPDFDRLFATVRLLLERSDNPRAVFLTAYQHRTAHRSIQALLRAWGLRARIVQRGSSDDPDARAETESESETDPRRAGPAIDIVEIVLESPARG